MLIYKREIGFIYCCLIIAPTNLEGNFEIYPIENEYLLFENEIPGFFAIKCDFENKIFG